MALTNPRYINLPEKGNIQGFWRMEETSGTRYDLSDNENNLTDNNTVGYAAGKIGNAADFEMSNTESLSITDANQTGLDITGEITIACWVKLETKASTAAHSHFLVCKYDVNSNNRAYSFHVDYTNDKLTFVLSPDGSATTSATSSSTLTSGTWYHIAATLNQATDKMQTYIDGSANGSSVSYTSNIYNSKAVFAIGSRGDLATCYDGLIDEVIIWNTCLTADEIAEVYGITEYKYNAGILNWWFCKDSWEKHDKLWKPKLLKPEFEI